MLVIIAGTIDFADPDARDSAIAASCDLQASTRDTEAGCLAYVFAADPVVPTRVHVYELWESEVCLAAHFEHPNYLCMRQILRQFPRAGSSVTMKYRCDLSEPVYDHQGRPRADFATAG